MKPNKYWSLITWCICLLFFILLIFLSFQYSIMDSFRIPICVVSVILCTALFIFTFHSQKRSSLINLITSAALIISCFAIHQLQKNQDSIFVEPAKIDEMYINFYVMSESYRSKNPDLFTETEPSASLSDCVDKTFILQSQFDQENQETAFEDMIHFMELDSLRMITKDSVYDAIKALYNGEGDILVLNQSFVSRTKQIPAFENFDEDTLILYTITIGNDTQPVLTEEGTDYEPFVCYIAGNDTRNDALTLVGRTDTDIIMTVNPNSKQILLISIPRDYYIENPALYNGLDKLTHLGNHGIQNTLDGINQYFDLDIKSYLTTNFTHFKDLIDTLGGITINNPYAFTTNNAGNYSFSEGAITLNGEEALAYSRERYNLDNGDFDRNEHQIIVMQGILEKIQELSKQGDQATIIRAIAKDFLTNLNIDDIYSVYQSTLNSDEQWEIIKYHLGGEGTYDGTISMGMNRQLYVCKPFASQVQFTAEMINKVLNGEIITQESLPDQDKTTYVEN